MGVVAKLVALDRWAEARGLIDPVGAERPAPLRPRPVDRPLRRWSRRRTLLVVAVVALAVVGLAVLRGPRALALLLIVAVCAVRVALGARPVENGQAWGRRWRARRARRSDAGGEPPPWPRA